jgi:hypothetical protein
MIRFPLQVVCIAMVALAGLMGCASNAPQTSTLQSDDLLVAGNKMKDSLAASDFLADRGPTSPPVVIMTNKVENLTDSIIPVGQQWSTVLRVQNALPVQQFAKTKNIRFVVPPEREEMAAAAGLRVADLGRTPATHVLSAQFLSSARTTEDKSGVITGKQDSYYLEFKLTDVQSRELVWSDAFEFKRAAKGILID